MTERGSSTQLSPQLISAITEVVQSARSQVKQVVNQAIVQAYWEVGRLIVEHEQQGQARAEYGKQQLKQLSEKLTNSLGKGFDISNLRKMRAFFQAYPIRDTVRPELSWSHYRALLKVEKLEAREWYAKESIDQNWSARALDRQINVLYYERLLASKDRGAVELEASQKTASLQESHREYLRDPYVLDFLDLPNQRMLETDLEQGIIDNLQRFLLELGKGFAFVERQQRITTDDQDFFLDLVFYNFKLKCFLLVDLKLGKLTHQDVGQMDTYVRIYDDHKKSDDDNPTIGLILCSQKSETIAKYSVLAGSQQLFASKYLPYLPSEEELRLELERERALHGPGHDL